MKNSNASAVRYVGVGIDTARYGHYVSFLRDDKQQQTSVFDRPDSCGPRFRHCEVLSVHNAEFVW